MGSGLVSRSPHWLSHGSAPRLGLRLAWLGSARPDLDSIGLAGLACGAARFNPDLSADCPLWAPDGVGLRTGPRLGLAWPGPAWLCLGRCAIQPSLVSYPAPLGSRQSWSRDSALARLGSAGLRLAPLRMMRKTPACPWPLAHIMGRGHRWQQRQKRPSREHPPGEWAKSPLATTPGRHPQAWARVEPSAQTSREHTQMQAGRQFPKTAVHVTNASPAREEAFRGNGTAKTGSNGKAATGELVDKDKHSHEKLRSLPRRS
jgi:hypothetical protein